MPLRPRAGHSRSLNVRCCGRQQDEAMKLKSRSVPKRVRGKRGPRPRNSVTLKMVAREAGVSASTASRIINRTVNVSDELRLAVEAAIAKFNFRPNAAARGLALSRTFTIGVVSQTIDSPFYVEALVVIQRRRQHLCYAPPLLSGNLQMTF